jgi:hypothetical protein
MRVLVAWCLNLGLLTWGRNRQLSTLERLHGLEDSCLTMVETAVVGRSTGLNFRQLRWEYGCLKTSQFDYYFLTRKLSEGMHRLK